MSRRQHHHILTISNGNKSYRYGLGRVRGMTRRLDKNLEDKTSNESGDPTMDLNNSQLGNKGH